MTKRPPEMVELERHDEPLGVCFMGQCDDGTWVNADDAIAAIRSLRVKLFRERAENHRLMYDVLAECAVTIAGKNRMAFHKRAKRRFRNIADAIERGER